MDMNRLKDGIREKVNTVKMLAVFCAGLLSIGMTACDDGLDVTQAYPFTVETMPVPKELAKGETAEIRCELVREGEFDGAVYTIRYFQFDGEGTLKLDNGLVFQPNDRYLLENEKFRLYYTSECDESQILTITVEVSISKGVMKRLLAPAVLAVAFSASLPAQNTGTVGTPASFKDEAKAGLAVELIKKYEGLHDRSDYPYYGYGHCKLPGEELSYDMTEAEAEKLLIRDLEKRYRLFSKYGKDALILTVLSYNVGHGTLLGYGKHPKSRLLKKLEAGDRDIYKEYISYCHYKGRKIRSIERRRKMEFLLLYEK